MTCVIAETAIEFARLADIVKYQHPAGHLATTVTNRRRGILDVQLVSIAADQKSRSNRLDRARTTNRHRHRVVERLTGLFMKTTKYFVDVAAGGVVEAPPGQLLGNRIDILHVALGIGGYHAVAD